MKLKKKNMKINDILNSTVKITLENWANLILEILIKKKTVISLEIGSFLNIKIREN